MKEKKVARRDNIYTKTQTPVHTYKSRVHKNTISFESHDPNSKEPNCDDDKKTTINNRCANRKNRNKTKPQVCQIELPQLCLSLMLNDRMRRDTPPN